MADYQIILEKAAFAGNSVEVATKGRGVFRGEFTGVDEFDTDENRLGYCLQTGAHEERTVFLDEILDIRVIPNIDAGGICERAAV